MIVPQSSCLPQSRPSYLNVFNGAALPAQLVRNRVGVNVQGEESNAGHWCLCIRHSRSHILWTLSTFPTSRSDSSTETIQATAGKSWK